MKRHSLSAMISFRFALLVLTAISLISVTANIMINRQFEGYVEDQQILEADNIAYNICGQYNDDDGGWNIDYIHGLGMYALEDGYIITLYDKDENVLWDAKNHDMSRCQEMMRCRCARMQETHPDHEGDFVTHRYDMKCADELTGYLDISFYSPYYIDENAFQFITALNRILLMTGIAALAGAVFIGILLANDVVKPISKVVEITQKISDGNYSTRFEKDVSAKELYELTTAVNQMAESLEEQEILRKRLASDVTHELRTPIANVSSYIEMMLDGILDATPERLQSCYDELQRLSSLISDLERLRQVENENLTLHKTNTDLLELAQSVMRNFESQLHSKHLNGEVAGCTAIVPADRDRIQQVLTNLISNAVKYSNENGMIRIIVEDTNDSGIIYIEDTGIGIPSDDLKRIFERFYRTDRSRTRRTGGAGIGLTIAKSIVQAHKGNITVESEEGKGSRFTVILPKEHSLEN